MKATGFIIAAVCAIGAVILLSPMFDKEPATTSNTATPAATEVPAPAPAEPSEAPSPAPEPELAALPKALQDVTWATDKKPNLHADYYIYLMSASWCGPCRALMPQIVEAYKNEMQKGAVVEVILTACEQSSEGVPAYLEKYGAGFPGIHISHPDVAKFVGYNRDDMRKGIPFVTICDKHGNVLDKGHRAFLTWKKTVGLEK